MRRVLIASVVAIVLFVVGAFAASFATVNSEDVTSGTNDVTACATTVDVDFETTYDATVNDWRVDGANLFFIGGTQCNTFSATLAVHVGAVATEYTSDALIAGGSAHVTIASGPLVAGVSRASVLVDGENITTVVSHN